MADRDPKPAYFEALVQPWGEPLATEYLSQTAAPALAGFSFALVALILQVEERLRCADLALALLIVAALFLVNAVQLGSIARRWYFSPSEWKELLSIAPEGDLPVLHAAGARALDKHSKWLRWTRLVYNIGVVVLLAAVAVSLLPPEARDPIEPWRIVAIAAAGSGAVLQAVTATLSGIRAFRWNRDVTKIAMEMATGTPAVKNTPETGESVETTKESIAGEGAEGGPHETPPVDPTQ